MDDETHFEPVFFTTLKYFISMAYRFNHVNPVNIVGVPCNQLSESGK